jgi:hypothetical protein
MFSVLVGSRNNLFIAARCSFSSAPNISQKEIQTNQDEKDQVKICVVIG